MMGGDGTIEQEILERTYKDIAQVFRGASQKDSKTKQMRQAEIKVVSDLVCGLSKDKSGGHSIANGIGRTVSSYTLFCAPSADVVAGDRLEITTLAGQTLSLVAGQPFAYLSHLEVPLSGEERA